MILSFVQSEWLSLYGYDPIRLVPGRAAHCGGSGSEFRGPHILRGAQPNQWHGYVCETFTSPLVIFHLSAQWGTHLADGPVECKGGPKMFSYGNKACAVYLVLCRNAYKRLFDERIAESALKVIIRRNLKWCTAQCLEWVCRLKSTIENATLQWITALTLPCGFLQTSRWETLWRQSWAVVTILQASWRLAASSPSVLPCSRPTASRLSTQISSANSSKSTSLENFLALLNRHVLRFNVYPVPYVVQSVVTSEWKHCIYNSGSYVTTKAMKSWHKL